MSEPTITWSLLYKVGQHDPRIDSLLERFLASRDQDALGMLEERARKGDLDSTYAIGAAHLLTGDIFGAIAYLEHVADLAPTNLLARIDLASAYIQVGYTDRAERELARVLGAPGLDDNVRASAWTEWEETKAWLEWRRNQTEFQIRRSRAMAQRFYRPDGKPEDGIGLARAQFRLAHIPGSGLDWPDVISTLERVRQMDGRNLDTLSLLAIVYHNNGDAVAMNRTLLEIEKVDPRANVLDLARDFPDRFPDEDGLFMAAIGDRPDSNEARAVLRSNYRVAPNSLRARRLLMFAELAAGNYEEADWLAASLRDDPRVDFESHLMLLQYYNLTGDREARDGSAREAEGLAGGPEDAATLRNLLSELGPT